MATQISVAEIREAIASVVPQYEDGFSTLEMCEAMGRGYDWGKIYMRKMVQAGVVEPVQMRRTRINGVPCIVTGYRLTGK